MLRLVPAALAFALLAAHFHRAGQPALIVAAGAAAALLLVRRPWANFAVRVALVMASVEWMRTLAALVALRRADGEPWLRVALIVGTVALLTVAAALVLRRDTAATAFACAEARSP